MKARNTPPRYVIGIDPGECTGVAFGVDGRLVHCYASKPDGKLVLPPSWPQFNGAPVLARIELPKFYGVQAYGGLNREGLAKAYSVANALIRESVSLGEWKRQLRDLHDCAIVEVLPRAWKGTAPKKAFTQRIAKQLTADERRIVLALGLSESKLHNVLDGVGLVLGAFGRLPV